MDVSHDFCKTQCIFLSQSLNQDFWNVNGVVGLMSEKSLF